MGTSIQNERQLGQWEVGQRRREWAVIMRALYLITWLVTGLYEVNDSFLSHSWFWGCVLGGMKRERQRESEGWRWGDRD